MSELSTPPPRSVSLPSFSGTPWQYKSSSNQSYGHSAPRPDNTGKGLQREMAMALADETIGGMPPEEFMKEFLPAPCTQLPPNLPDFKRLATTSDKLSALHIAPRVSKESDMYPSFLQLVHKSPILGGNFYHVNTSATPDRNSREDRRWKPDITLRHRGQSEVPNHPASGSTNFDLDDLLYEFKPAGSSHAYDDPGPKDDRASFSFQSEGEDGLSFRGQITASLTELCARQHRTHAFSILISDPIARFIRSDRAGIVVSEGFDFREKPKILSEFLWRYCQLSPSQRGFDPTVRDANPEETKIAHEKLVRWKPGPKVNRKVVVIEVPTKEGPPRRVLAWGSLRDAESLTGRATRAYPVWDLDAKKVLFFKDVWRAEGLEKETDVLEDLNAANVPFIPEVFAGGDVTGDDGELQETLTQEYITQDWRAGPVGPLAKRVHHRILEDFVPHTLKACKNAKQVMTVLSHAFLAHEMAYERGYLHRDLSHNNILVVRISDDEFQGILIDWDLCLRVKDKAGNPIAQDLPRQRYRTGTWYFMSAALLGDSEKQHLLRDDLESFFHLILYVSIIWFRPRGLPNPADIFIQKVFQQVEDNGGGRKTGGGNKVHMFTYGLNITFEDNNAITTWIDDAHALFHQFYDCGKTLAYTKILVTKNRATQDDLAKALENFNVACAPLETHEVLRELFTTALASPADSWADTKTEEALTTKLKRPRSKSNTTPPVDPSGGLSDEPANKRVALAFELDDRPVPGPLDYSPVEYYSTGLPK